MLLIQAEIRKSGFEEMIGSGIVLTGGSSRIEGMMDLAEEIFHLPVRQGLPNYEGSLSEVIQNPIYSTGIGLAQFGYRHGGSQPATPSHSARVGSVFDRMKGWFKGSF